MSPSPRPAAHRPWNDSSSGPVRKYRTEFARASPSVAVSSLGLVAGPHLPRCVLATNDDSPATSAQNLRTAPLAAGAVRRVLAREGGDEAWVVPGVTPPQAPRLAREAVRPLEAAPLHPRRRLGDDPGVEVERGADAREDRGVETVAHVGHPLLLLRLACADPHDVRARRGDARGDVVLLGLGQWAERRRPAADDAQAGVAAQQG